VRFCSGRIVSSDLASTTLWHVRAIRATHVRPWRGAEACRGAKGGLRRLFGAAAARLAIPLLPPYGAKADCDRLGVAPAGRPKGYDV
jgi:hypothetical protein